MVGSIYLSGGTGETDAFVDTYSGTYNRSTATYSGGLMVDARHWQRAGGHRFEYGLRHQ